MKRFFALLEGKRALSKKQVEDSGFPKKDYTYEVPIGDYSATLDMKEWGNKINLNCYFTTEHGEKFVLSAYEHNEIYSPYKCNLDMSDINMKIGEKFLLSVGRSKTGRTKWLHVKKI